jgi:hypothetical protein
MFIAQRLRKENIAEYLLYMWQVEDTLRAYGCDIRRIGQEYVPQFNLDEDRRAELVNWYDSLCSMMRSEGVKESGHLQINRNVVAELEELSQQLLESPNFQRYHSAFFALLPDIMELRRRGNASTLGDIEVCFNALYGTMMLRLAKKPLGTETEEAIKRISGVMAMLAAYYRSNREKPLDFGDATGVS